MRKFAGLLVLCCASMALAQNGGVIEGTRGAGVAQNADGKAARFSFGAARAMVRDRTVVNGSLELRIVERDARHALAVVLPVVKRLAVSPHHAEFGGPGFLGVTDGNHVRRIPGTVVAAVADLDVPTDEENNADTIRVRFTPERATDRSFGFEGEVTRGDIVVQDAP